MHSQPDAAANEARRESSGEWRQALKDAALREALRKRELGVPTYKVPEAAALLSVSPEYLYRLIQEDKFPAVRLNGGGRNVVAAQLVERMLADGWTDTPGGAA